jgi:hypothetical protein
MTQRKDAVGAILSDLKTYASVYSEAYLSFKAAGLENDQASNEARVIAFMAVSPASETTAIPGFEPKVGEA